MWRHPAWLGTLLPPSSADHPLHHYSRYFNSIEGNTSFYQLPSADNIRLWQQSVPQHFGFTFKFPKSISHELRLQHCQKELTECLQRFMSMAPQINVLMLQLPASFAPQDLPLLGQFLQQLPTDLSYAVEVRHLGFFDKRENEKRFNQLLMQHQVNRVIMDTRGLFACPANGDPVIIDAQGKKPKVPTHAIATADMPIVRFVGHPQLAQNLQYLKPWVTKVKQWLDEGKSPHLFFHTADNTEAPWLAQLFFQQMNTAWPELDIPTLQLPDNQQQIGMF